jgi:ATP-binding cassette subfamily F protein uup
MEQQATDYTALERLSREKETLEEQLDTKMERWVYLNDLAERIAAQQG